MYSFRNILYIIGFRSFKRIENACLLVLGVHCWNEIVHQWREVNVLFNDALNTFYLRLYGIGHMVKNHSDSKRRNPLLQHRLLFPISSKCSLYAPSHRQDSIYHNLCYTSRGALAGTRNSSMDPPHEGSIRGSIVP